MVLEETPPLPSPDVQPPPIRRDCQASATARPAGCKASSKVRKKKARSEELAIPCSLHQTATLSASTRRMAAASSSIALLQYQDRQPRYETKKRTKTPRQTALAIQPFWILEPKCSKCHFGWCLKTNAFHRTCHT